MNRHGWAALLTAALLMLSELGVAQSADSARARITLDSLRAELCRGGVQGTNWRCTSRDYSPRLTQLTRYGARLDTLTARLTVKAAPVPPPPPPAIVYAVTLRTEPVGRTAINTNVGSNEHWVRIVATPSANGTAQTATASTLTWTLDNAAGVTRVDVGADRIELQDPTRTGAVVVTATYRPVTGVTVSQSVTIGLVGGSVSPPLPPPPPPVDTTPVPPLPPPTSGSVTPANLTAILGAMIRRPAVQTEPVKTFDVRYAATELARYNIYASNATPDHTVGANHYDALRSRLEWSIRNGLPFGPSATDPANSAYARGRRIVLDYLTGYAKPAFYATPAHNGTGMYGIEALYVLEGNTMARDYIHVHCMDASYDLDGTKKFQQGWSDARTIAVALQSLSACHRNGFPFARSPANTQMGFDASPGSWRATGERQIAWLDQYNVVRTNGAVLSPTHSGGSIANPTVEAYLFNAMLATELLRWHGYVAPHSRALQIARNIIDHLITVSAGGILPYVSSSAHPDYAGPAHDLAAYYVWPSLVLWQETGDAKYREFAVRHLAAANTGYIDGLKQWNQVFSTGAQGAEALLTGVRWR